MAAKKKRKQNDPTPGWAWMLIGLSIGLSVALLVWLRAGNPQNDLPPRATQTSQSTVPAPTLPPEPAARAVAELPPADDGDSSGVEFDFFEALPEAVLVVPEGEFDFGPDADTSGQVIFQAGSFPDLSRADQRKAALARIGIESDITRVNLSGEIFYRVNIGPVTGRAEINRTARRLSEAGIEYLSRAMTD